jgi:uncharacterized protein
MKKALLILFLSIAAILSSYGQTKEESIRELLHANETDSMIDKNINSMIPMMFDKIMLKEKDTIFKNKVKEQLNTQNSAFQALEQLIMNEVVKIYDRNFTEEEINQYLAFFRTDAGKKFVKTTPFIMRESMKSMQPVAPQISRIINDIINEIKKRENK